MFGVILDGVTYHLRVKYETIRRSARIADGDNAAEMLSGLYQRDLIGTYYDYEMQVEADPSNQDEYDRFYAAITAPVDVHTITLPFGSGSLTFQAMITAATDTYRGKVRGQHRWGGLSVSFSAVEPYLTPDDDILVSSDSLILRARRSGS